MSELPDGWNEVTLAEVGAITTGNTPPTKEPDLYGGDTPFVKPGDLDFSHPITMTEQNLSAKGAKWARLVRPGAVLVSCIGNLGKVGIAGTSLATNQQINTIEFNSRLVIDRYGFYYCKTLRDWMNQEASATTISILNKGKFSQAPFILAPIEEQKRIADKLDAMRARVDACRERLDRIPAVIKRFRKAVLAAATSGELTAEWRTNNKIFCDSKDLVNHLRTAHMNAGGHKAGNAAPPTEDVHDLTPELFPDGWHIVDLREIVRPEKPITYGILKPGPELEVGVPYIRVADFPNNVLNLSTVRKTSYLIDKEFSRARLMPGDIILSIRGTVGRLIIVPLELDQANITQDTARLSIQPVVNRDYIIWFLRSDMAQTRMKKAEKGVAVRGINIGDVRALQIPIPSREEQNEIVRRVEKLFAYADKLETRYKSARAAVDRLTPALLAKAFRGELVPQDPNDEPAAALLERTRPHQQEFKAKRGSGVLDL